MPNLYCQIKQKILRSRGSQWRVKPFTSAISVPGKVPGMDVRKRFNGEKKENVGTVVKSFNYKPHCHGKGRDKY